MVIRLLTRSGSHEVMRANERSHAWTKLGKCPLRLLEQLAVVGRAECPVPIKPDVEWPGVTGLEERRHNVRQRQLTAAQRTAIVIDARRLAAIGQIDDADVLSNVAQECCDRDSLQGKWYVSQASFK